MIDQSYRMTIELWMGGFRVSTIQSSFLALIDHVCRYIDPMWMDDEHPIIRNWV
jgi:hypothetical protein